MKAGKLWTGGKTTLCDAQTETARATSIRWKKNGLRHSFISYRLAIRKDAGEVALEAGNSPSIIFSHYRELVTQMEADRWFGLIPRVVDKVISIPA